MLISEAQERERERYICYFHKPIVQRWTTPSSSWRQWRCRWRRRTPLRQRSAGVSPLQSAASWSLFLVSLVWQLSLRKTSGGGSLYRRFQVTRKLQEEGSTQTEPRGAKEVGPRGQVQGPRGAPSFGPPVSVCLLPSLWDLLPSKKNDPRKFSAHYDVVKALK